MNALLGAGNPFEHTWNTWGIEFYKWIVNLNAFPVLKQLGVTNAVVMMLFAAALIAFLCLRGASECARAASEGRAPRGLGAVMEQAVLFIRDAVLKPAMPHHERSPYFIALFATLFCFILTCNLLGLMPQPFGRTATGSPFVNLGLAFGVTYLIGIWGAGFYAHGIGFLAHIAPHAPFPVRWFVLWPIEFAGLLVKPVALTIRLTANMTAGHIILAVLMSFVLGMFHSVGQTVGGAAGALGFFAITAFELAIAFIQAYIFTVLSSVFVGASLSHEH